MQDLDYERYKDLDLDNTVGIKRINHPLLERAKIQSQTVFDDDVQIIINEKILSDEQQRQRLNNIIRLVFATP